jgi:hypothetical protein
MSTLFVRFAGANFSLQLRSPCLSDIVEGVMGAESSYEHWGLLHRLQRVLELLDNAEAAGEAGGQLSLCVHHIWYGMGVSCRHHAHTALPALQHFIWGMLAVVH